MSKELTVEHIPSLVVAKDVNGLYIPIGNVDKHNEYYCPVCNNIVKPRALSSKKEQPHYYHVNDECSKESQLHWLYKNWLLVKNTEIIIGNKAYVVKDCEVEPTIETKFGVYNPDLRITTMDNNIFYFEMAYSNKKDQTYCDKWDDLNAEVVEVDIKELINSNSKNVLPKFNLIYTNGKYTKNYEKRERKDKYYSFKNALKYDERKNMISDLNWIWNEINNEDITKICLDNIDYEVLVDVTRWFKQIKCVDKYEYLLRYCKDRFYTNLCNLYPLADISIVAESQRKLNLIFRFGFEQFKQYETVEIPYTSKTKDCLISENVLKTELSDISRKHKKCEEFHNAYAKLEEIEFDTDIKYQLYLMPITRHEKTIHVQIFKVLHGDTLMLLDVPLNENGINHIKSNLNKFADIENLWNANNQKIEQCSIDFNENVDWYNRKIKREWCKWFNVKKDGNDYVIKTFNETRYCSTNYEDVVRFERDLQELLDGYYLSGWNHRINLVSIADEINHCKNKYWHLNCVNYNEYILYLYNNNTYVGSKVIELENRNYEYSELKEMFTEVMIDMIKNSYSDTRLFLEVANEKE